MSIGRTTCSQPLRLSRTVKEPTVGGAARGRGAPVGRGAWWAGRGPLRERARNDGSRRMMQHEGPRIRQALLSIGVRARSKGHDRKRNQRAGCSEGHMLVTLGLVMPSSRWRAMGRRCRRSPMEWGPLRLERTACDRSERASNLQVRDANL